MPSSPERVLVTDAPPPPELALRVGEELARGRLVALPTETVYGIAARADLESALDALRELKGRPQELALTWHVGTKAALERFPRLSPMALRLVERYWPGPLTLVLPGVPEGLERIAREGWTGVRLPAQGATAGLLAELDFPVVLSSANRHGEPPRSDAEALERDFGPGLALVVDAGPSQMKESSAVLKVGPGHFELLRPGLYTLAQLARTAGLRVAFVCTGNTCRSPMAEGLARAKLAERLGTQPAKLGDFGFELRSMGVFAGVGTAVSPHAVTVVGEQGIDIAEHRSMPATLEEILAHDRVYCMTAAHKETLRLLLPPGKDEHVELLDPEGGDVPDPFGGGIPEYSRCAERLDELVTRRLDEWA